MSRRSAVEQRARTFIEPLVGAHIGIGYANAENTARFLTAVLTPNEARARFGDLPSLPSGAACSYCRSNVVRNGRCLCCGAPR